MSNDDDKPWWWPLVVSAGLNPDQWEPVKYQERTKPGEKILNSQGWVDTADYDSHYSYTSRHPPRIRRKKVKMVTWRLCVLLRPGIHFLTTVRCQWIQSDKIEEPWCALESQTNPFETVKTLPEGEEP